ncbi:MAG: ABC transporter ATP-binding protein [Caldilineales bacterium]|nr:ABC transporter ATP-binding protein [Caldilineales bacterium]
MSAPAETFICIVGPSGCGKSTLLRLIAGLTSPTIGSIDFDDVTPGDRLRSGMVFQEQGLFPWLTIIDNVAFGLEAQGINQRERHQRAMAFLQKVGLEGFSHNYPHQLSGGMRQRAAIARAFLADPDILLMDEPLAALDAQTRLILQEELLNIWKEQRKTVVYVTHDIEEAILLGDRVLVMTGRPGRIRADITIPLERPRTLAASDEPRVKEIKWSIWRMLEDEVRRGLSPNLQPSVH